MLLPFGHYTQARLITSVVIVGLLFIALIIYGVTKSSGFTDRQFVAVNSSVGCTGDECLIDQRQPDVPRSNPNNPPASWYVYGPNSEPIVTWMRRGQVEYNKWSMGNYIAMIDHPTGVPVLPM